jgi:hypothetical protein
MAHTLSKWLPVSSKSLHRIGLLVSSFLIVSAILLSHGASAANVAFNGPFDSDANAVIFGGARDCTQVQQSYAADASIQAIYAFFFIGQSTINNFCNAAVAGQVTKDGQVIVGGKVIATNALTAGRLNMTGSTKVAKNGVVFYVRPPSVSFVSNSLNAFVVLNNGKFLYAILSSCGNPVAATPVTPAPAPTPTPTPTPTPKPTPTPVTTITNVNNNINNIEVIQAQSQSQTQTQTQPAPTQTTLTPATSTAAVVTTTPAAAVLPNTGPGSVAGILGATVGVATLGHYFFTRRRLSRS